VATTTGLRRSEQMLLFGRNFFKHPKMLGSLIPSSRFLIRQLLAPVDWDRARVIVEYGPGVGTITTEVLRRMRPDARMIAIDTNRDFADYLGRRIRDPRFEVVLGSAADVERILAERGITHADYAISGIPYTTIPVGIREEILRATRRVLEPGGTFLVYQFTRAVLHDLREVFGHVEEGFEPLNVLPARLFFAPTNGTSAPGPNGKPRTNGTAAGMRNGRH